MLNWLRKLLLGPVLWASNKFSSKPDRERIFKALSSLLDSISRETKRKGLIIPFDSSKDRIIIFSDQHKGARNGADDFAICEPSYLAALDHYYQQGYLLIGLGDCEELWENTVLSIKRHQRPSFEKEKKFVDSDRFVKIFGNHDLYWQNDPFAPLLLKEIYGREVPIYEGVLLRTQVDDRPVNIFCTHGHQGDSISDGNWFSKFFISKIWAPLQSFLRINPNTPAYDAQLKTAHNQIMYEWSAAQKNLLLITGHTHQPIFESLTHLERLYRGLLHARQDSQPALASKIEDEIRLRRFEYDHVSPDYLQLKPGYFNTGCCCYSDGDITGIEIERDCFRLIKWTSGKGIAERLVLEEASIAELIAAINR